MEIGDEVVFVDDIDWNGELKYGEKCTILDKVICKCGIVTYDVGIRLENSKDRVKCSCGVIIVGAGIHWVKSTRFVPYNVNFKKFCNKTIIEQIYKDIEEFLKNKEYEKAIDTIKRLEKIENVI